MFLYSTSEAPWARASEGAGPLPEMTEKIPTEKEEPAFRQAL
jgi:hypothetical protein